ncbi:MAG: threonine synthase [Oscillospiraceae bacterium]|nr:threonine synthase [Oscillospiraceae bacterium]
MLYYSTRDKNRRVTASRAISDGLAPDGGLYIPECIPQVSAEKLEALCEVNYRERATYIMGLYLDEFSEEELREMTEQAYGDNFETESPAPLRFLDEKTAFLELWHGPSCAFKDMALQMLPHLLTASLKKCGEQRSVCILTATSGDTGKAALEGFCEVPGTRVVVFYPQDGVSEMQKLQMVTQKGNNVLVSAVEGNFDDAQTGVKKIFGDKALAERLDGNHVFLSSANSMNWGRLLPQIVYYFSAYCDYVSAGKLRCGEKLDFCVPTGNFGNILAGYYAKRMGLPVGRLLCASNANDVLTEFIDTGVYNRNRSFLTTISPSMDILVSSNLERLLMLLSDSDSEVRAYMEALSEDGCYTVSDAVRQGVQETLSAGCCDDTRTKETIATVFRAHDYLIDPHTAVAARVLEDYREKTGEKRPCVVVSTANPYKFASDVLDALGGSAPEGRLLETLAELSGTSIPVPLRGLNELPVRFGGCVSKADMSALVENYLS